MLRVIDPQLPIDRASGERTADLIRMRKEMRRERRVARDHLVTEHEAHRATELTIEERNVLFVDRMAFALLA